ncbi:hypothetical protein [Streptomyces sp. NBC_01264]|uniref:hypothetical protein n=1 Tax=Streptomyces sp. NBC_01264 TaxID=2903804 RepID=UPI00225A2C84|nr:hypothetical protein [Streptomyces sp. NBC_01264]MCX4783707.1 hypothetical protein [Streptomyces sp. NBC_01264]
MNVHRTPGHSGARLRRPAVLGSALAASLAFALTGITAPAFAAAAPVAVADTPHQSKGGDCNGHDGDRRDGGGRGSGYCNDHRGGISYELQSRTVEATFTVLPGMPKNGSVACDAGWLIDSGGVELSSPLLFLQKSIKGVSSSWETTVVNNDTTSHTYDVAIVCSRLIAIQH